LIGSNHLPIRHAAVKGLSTRWTSRPECKNGGSNEERDPDHFTPLRRTLTAIDKIIKLKLQHAAPSNWPPRQNVQHDGARRCDLDHRSQIKRAARKPPVDPSAYASAKSRSALAELQREQFGAPADVIVHALAGRDIGPLATALALVDVA
jgi:hypothetical protein